MSIVRVPYPNALPTVTGDYAAQNDLIYAAFLYMQHPVPVVAGNIVKGAMFNIGGTVYQATGNTAITGTPSAYVKITPAGATASAAYVANLSGVAWNDTYAGYYDGSGNLYVFDESRAVDDGVLTQPHRKRTPERDERGHVEDTRVIVLSVDRTLMPHRRHLVVPADYAEKSFTLPEALRGDVVDVQATQSCRIIQGGSEQAILLGEQSTTKGVTGWLQLRRGDKLRLTYKGAGWIQNLAGPTQMADPATPPTSTGAGGIFSPNGRFLYVSQTSANFLVYDMQTGAPVKVADPATMPTGITGNGCWSPDSKYLCVPHATAPYMSIYDFSGVTSPAVPPVKIADPPSGNPGSSGVSAAWSDNGLWLSIIISNTPFIALYDWTTGAPVKMANPVSLPPGLLSFFNWMPGSRFLGYLAQTTPYIGFYDMITGVPVKQAQPVTIPPNGGSGGMLCGFSPDGRWFLVGNATGPAIRANIYDWQSGFPVLDPDWFPTSGIFDGSSGAAWSPGGRLLFFGKTYGGNTKCYDLAQGYCREIFTVAAYLSNPMWSPDGRYTYFRYPLVAPYIRLYDWALAVNDLWLAEFEGKARKNFAPTDNVFGRFH